MKPEEYARMFDLEDHYWWFLGRRSLVRTLLRRYRVWRREDRILDVGCGSGATLALLADFGKPVGLDASLTALGFCRSRGNRALVRALAEQVPFSRDTFDAVLALDVLEHVPDDRRVLGELWRICRPGGLAVVTVPAFSFLWSGHDEALHHLRRYRAPEIGERMAAAGFEILKLSYVMSLLFVPIALYRLIERVLSPKSEPETTLRPVPGVVNRLLYWVLRLESVWVRWWRFPVGVSVVCIGRKAHGEA